MDENKTFKELENLLSRLSIEIKYRKGYFRGGLCRFRDQNYFYLNKVDKVEHHIALILSELEKMNLSDINLPQSIEELLSKSEASREE